MDWLRERVWQLGIAVILVLVGGVIIYVSASDDGSTARTWLGLVLVFVAMLIPLANKVYQSTQEEQGEKGEA